MYFGSGKFLGQIEHFLVVCFLYILFWKEEFVWKIKSFQYKSTTIRSNQK